MAKKIKVNIAGAAFTGKIVTFKAPCDCTEATGLVIGEDTYDVVDALGNCITGSYLAWSGGAVVSVALDVDSKKAFLQNEKPTPAAIGAAPAPLSAHKTLYVATTGNDATGDGTQSNPYATIQRALNTLPKDLGDYKVIINVGAGEYDGFIVAGFWGGYSNNPGITIKGESRDTVIITGETRIQSCLSYIMLQNLHFTGNTSGYNLLCLANRLMLITACQMDGTTAAGGVWIYNTSTAGIFNTIVSDKTGSAIYSDMSTVFLSSLSGSNNTIGLRIGSNSSCMPGLAVLNSFGITADTQYVKEKGGVIIAGNAFV